MLKKIIEIKNVGRFKNSAAIGNPQLAKHTFVVGANGYGKTTLCAVLRSLQTGDPAYVLGRKTLDATSAPEIKMLLDNGPSQFDGTAWSVTKPEIAIFDERFIAENVHSGEVVDIEHKRNLYRVIIGDAGVKLAAEDDELSTASRAKTGEIRTAAIAIKPHIPVGIELPDFLALPELSDIVVQVESQTRDVEAMRQAGAIQERAPLSELVLPALPVNFESLLARTIDHIAHDAEKKLTEHLSAHGMTADGRNWIKSGLDQAKESCPFCGQDIKDLPLVDAFRAVFSDHYRALANDIAGMRKIVSQDLGEANLARLETLAEQNNGGIDFWRQYCLIEGSDLTLPADAVDATRALAGAALALLDCKLAAPLDQIVPDETFKSAQIAYKNATDSVATVNVAIRGINSTIEEKKAATDVGNLQAAEAALIRLKAIEIRHQDEVVELCNSYKFLVQEKADIDNRKQIVRKQLDSHTEAVVQPYEHRINEFLSVFNAGFSITRTKHAYPGGHATSSYQLVINDTAVDLGDSKTPTELPSFKNTLSAGDRTTLALAFFLAHLKLDPATVRKLVVFDDPFNSQDAFRKSQTVHEIINVAKNCAQVIVLSHDANFLKQVWDKSPASERVSLSITDHRAEGSKILPIDLKRACKGRTAKDIDDLQAFLSTGSGEPLDIIRKMRVVLETYCRTTYPNSFCDDDWLGDIVRKMRGNGASHPVQVLYDELDQINEYTKQYHHGENVSEATSDNIDPVELAGFTRRTLQIANALQA